MPTAAPRPCTHPGCPRYGVRGARCEAHPYPSGWVEDRRRGNRHQRGYGSYWDKLRPMILRRDDYACRCERCQASAWPREASEVDHIVPKARGGTDDPSNLQAMHPECHERKTQRERGRRS